MSKSFGFLLLIVSAAYADPRLPFFDNNPATVLSPVKPDFTQIDDLVLQLCDAWGDPITGEERDAFIRNREIQTLMRQINASFLMNRTYPEFVKWFTHVWFAEQGVSHIFCGEPEKNKLGGLHYFPRFWQAQNEGWASLADKHHRRVARYCGESDWVQTDHVFIVGIMFLNRDREERVKCMSSYHLHMNAEDVLVEATRALTAVVQKVGAETSFACVHAVRATDSYAAHYSLLVVANGSIRTYYPLTTNAVNSAKYKNMRRCVS